MIIAALIAVSTPTELLAAINNAAPGDEIVLADGTYALTANVTCDSVGTDTQPIIVRAANPLAAHITFNALEGFKVSGAHWRFEGLDISGVCANDSNCEHAFHVTGAAHNFVLRNSRVREFNAQIKVNASMIGASYVTPNDGLIEYNEIGDTRGRSTSNPVTKINIDSGEDWIVRGNYIHDAYKAGGDNISYQAFMKSGSLRGLFERNLVICSRETTGGTRLGLSFGGGGTGAAFCAPAFDPDVPCTTEHTGGTMRNNLIVNCSDVGIYLNESVDTHILYNTLVATNGIDFRFATTSGEAVGNLMTSVPRIRDGASMNASGNMTSVTLAQFEDWYTDPLAGDFSENAAGDVSVLVATGPARADVTDDYCGKARPTGELNMGAIEYPPCNVTRPPMPTDPGNTSDAGVGSGGDAGTPGGGDPDEDGGGGCCETGRSANGSGVLAVLALGYVLRRRRRQH